eukprot:13428838-Alexandrium_andersonii.AAC.1
MQTASSSLQRFAAVCCPASPGGEGRTPPTALPSAGGAARRAAPPLPGPVEWGSPTFADSEPRRGAFGPLGALGPRPPRAGFWTPTLL